MPQKRHTKGTAGGKGGKFASSAPPDDIGTAAPLSLHSDTPEEPEWDRIRRRTAVAIKEHEAQTPGSVPPGLKAWSDKLINPPEELEPLSKSDQEYREYLIAQADLRASSASDGAATSEGVDIRQHEAQHRNSICASQGHDLYTKESSKHILTRCNGCDYTEAASFIA